MLTAHVSCRAYVSANAPNFRYRLLGLLSVSLHTLMYTYIYIYISLSKKTHTIWVAYWLYSLYYYLSLSPAL